MTTFRFILLFILLLAILPSVSADTYKHLPTRTDTYDEAIRVMAGADVLDIIDGNTIKVSAHMWPWQKWLGNVRLFGIDTTEINLSRCQAEKDQGIMARDTLVSLVPPRVLLDDIKDGKFGGRFVAAVMDGTRDMAHVLMEERGRQA